MANNCDKIVGGVCIVIIVSVVIFIVVKNKEGMKPLGPRRDTHPLGGFNPQIFKRSPFKQSWDIPQTQTFPLIGFNQTGVSLSTMPPNIPTPSEYFSKPIMGAAAVLPTDVSTVRNALSQGAWAIANGQVRVPTGKLRNTMYNSWGSENVTTSRPGRFNYMVKPSTNLDSPSFQCGNFLPQNGGMQRARDVCSNTPGCIGFVAGKNKIPICLKSRTEQQRFYKDSDVDYYEKVQK